MASVQYTNRIGKCMEVKIVFHHNFNDTLFSKQTLLDGSFRYSTYFDLNQCRIRTMDGWMNSVWFINYGIYGLAHKIGVKDIIPVIKCVNGIRCVPEISNRPREFEWIFINRKLLFVVSDTKWWISHRVFLCVSKDNGRWSFSSVDRHMSIHFYECFRWSKEVEFPKNTWRAHGNELQFTSLHFKCQKQIRSQNPSNSSATGMNSKFMNGVRREGMGRWTEKWRIIIIFGFPTALATAPTSVPFISLKIFNCISSSADDIFVGWRRCKFDEEENAWFPQSSTTTLNEMPTIHFSLFSE